MPKRGGVIRFRADSPSQKCKSVAKIYQNVPGGLWSNALLVP